MLTNLLRSHRGLISQPVLVDLDFPRQPLPIQRWSHKHLGQLGWTPALDLHERILLNDVRHLFLLLLSFVDLFLEVGDLPRDGVKAAAISRPVRD